MSAKLDLSLAFVHQLDLEEVELADGEMLFKVLQKHTSLLVGREGPGRKHRSVGLSHAKFVTLVVQQH